MFPERLHEEAEAHTNEGLFARTLFCSESKIILSLLQSYESCLERFDVARRGWR